AEKATTQIDQAKDQTAVKSAQADGIKAIDAAHHAKTFPDTGIEDNSTTAPSEDPSKNQNVIIPSYRGIHKNMAVIMNKGGYLYSTSELSQIGRVHYKAGNRQKRPMFVVEEIIRRGNQVIYKVRDVNKRFANSNPKTNGKRGYIVADKNIVNAYYSGKAKQFRVINRHGINTYKQLNLTQKTKHVRFGQTIQVVAKKKHNMTYRYRLGNGSWITANKKLVRRIK
ncbi:DUF5776 domain-containing protein, partial [Secundilactobacillus kimchicus]|uniref:DUF5776 domain-containing protein n=1 Tax=Secundilactobacillus kimchicus TaxID=528209 RepID=UPI0024A8E624